MDTETPKEDHFQIIGPFLTEFKLAVDGYLVPYITACKTDGGENDGQLHLTVDGRFGVTCADEAEAQKWVWFIANAMAVTAGYSCHGEYCQPSNPFKVQIGCLN